MGEQMAEFQSYMKCLLNMNVCLIAAPTNSSDILKLTTQQGKFWGDTENWTLSHVIEEFGSVPVCGGKPITNFSTEIFTGAI